MTHSHVHVGCRQCESLCLRCFPNSSPATAHVSSSRTLTPPSRSDQSRAHTFAEMVLREEEEEEEDFEIIFSPVLIWKPGRRKRRNKAQNFQATAGEDRVCTCPNNTTTTTTGAVEGGVVGSATVGATQTTKSPLPLRRMDLTVSLPPERTLKNQVERKVMYNVCTCMGGGGGNVVWCGWPSMR